MTTRCTSVEQFVAMFYRFCDEKSFFVATLHMRQVGLDTPFAIQLADRAPVLRGTCVVLDAWPTGNNPFGRPGIRLGFRRLTSDSETVLRLLLAVRDAAPARDATRPVEPPAETPVPILPAATARPKTIPPVPVKTRPPTGPVVVVPPKRPTQEIPVVQVAPPPPPIETPEAESTQVGRTPAPERTPGSPLVLPANPLMNLSDESLVGFVDCTLYEETSTFFRATDDGHDFDEPAAPPPMRPNTLVAEVSDVVEAPIEAIAESVARISAQMDAIMDPDAPFIPRTRTGQRSTQPPFAAEAPSVSRTRTASRSTAHPPVAGQPLLPRTRTASTAPVAAEPPALTDGLIMPRTRTGQAAPAFSDEPRTQTKQTQPLPRLRADRTPEGPPSIPAPGTSTVVAPPPVPPRRTPAPMRAVLPSVIPTVIRPAPVVEAPIADADPADSAVIHAPVPTRETEASTPPPMRGELASMIARRRDSSMIPKLGSAEPAHPDPEAIPFRQGAPDDESSPSPDPPGRRRGPMGASGRRRTPSMSAHAVDPSIEPASGPGRRRDPSMAPPIESNVSASMQVADVSMQMPAAEPMRMAEGSGDSLIPHPVWPESTEPRLTPMPAGERFAGPPSPPPWAPLLAMLARVDRRYLIGGGAGAFVLVVLIIAIAAGGSSSHADDKTADVPAAAPAPVTKPTPPPAAPQAVQHSEAALPDPDPTTEGPPVIGDGPCKLDVSTTPAGSMVAFDGRTLGPSPLTLAGTCAAHQVEISHPRYKTEQRAVTMIADKANALDVTLVRPTHSLRVFTNPAGANVYIAGRSAGTSPTVVQVMGFTGLDVKVERNGFTPVTTHIYSKSASDQLVITLKRAR